MKILVPTYVMPDVKHVGIDLINSVLPYLREKTNTEIIWIVFQPDKILKQKTNGLSIYDIHDFPNAVSILHTTKPDCVVVTNTTDAIQSSLIIAAKFLKIPVATIYFHSYDFQGLTGLSTPVQNFKESLGKFFSNQTSTDKEHQKKSFRRGKFILYKYNFLKKTRKAISGNNLNALLFTLKEIFIQTLGKSKNYNELSELHLLSDNSWLKPLTNLGISKEKLIVTGNPYWDELFQKLEEIKYKHTQKKSNINILVITDALVEHGVWTPKKRDAFLGKLFDELKKETNISFSIKIHPSSEDRYYYETFFHERKTKIRIFQREDLWDIINDFDVVISYGCTTAHTELVLMGMKILLLDAEVNSLYARLVKEGLSSGIVLKCESFSNIIPSIHKLLENKIEITKNLIKERNQLFQSDGKASERVANAILKIVK